MPFEIRLKSDGSVVHYYEGDLKTFGGPWGDVNLYEHISVVDRPPPAKPFTLKDLADSLIARGTIVKADLPAEGQRIVG